MEYHNVINTNLITDYANLHMFPHPVREPELFAQWLQATRHIITETEPEIIYKKYKVCHEHFPSDMKYRQFILRTAVPCLNLKGKVYLTI